MSSRNRHRHILCVTLYPYRLCVKNRLSSFQLVRRPTASMTTYSGVALYSRESYLHSEREPETTLCLELSNNITFKFLMAIALTDKILTKLTMQRLKPRVNTAWFIPIRSR